MKNPEAPRNGRLLFETLWPVQHGIQQTWQCHQPAQFWTPRPSDRRNEEGLTKREQDKKDRIEKIKVFLSKGLNQSKIAQELGISRQAVSKLCKEI